MDQLNFWIDPVVELPPAVAAAVLAGILAVCLWRVRLGIFLLILTVPLQRFVVIPGLLGSRFTPHEAAFLSLALSMLVRGGVGFKISPPWTNPIAFPFMMLLFAGVLSLLGNPFAFDGLPELMIMAYLFLLMHVIYDFCGTPEDALYAYRAWYLTGIAFILLATYGVVVQLTGGTSFLMMGPRLMVTFFNPNQTGSFILATAFLFLDRASHPLTTRLRRLANLALVLCSVLAGYFTASRATVLGGAVGLVIFLAVRRVRISAILAVAAMLIAGNFGMSVFQQQDEHTANLYNTRYSEGLDTDSRSAEGRLENWQTGFDAFARSPVVGIGFGTLYLQSPPTMGESYQVHNTYISFLAETGILGFGALLGIIVLVTRACIQGLRLARGTPYEDHMVALIPALAALAVFNIFHYGVRARHLWLVIALILAFHRLAARYRASLQVPAIAAAPVPRLKKAPGLA
ncbi:MAG: O-antigen ligase family protein [Myxococcales bacterium]